MAGKLLEQKAGIQFAFIPYKSHPMAVQGLVSGEVDLMITDPLSFGGFIKSGQIRLLAATSPARMPGFTDVPTLVEAGVPDSELSSAHLMMVKAGTPPEIVGKLTEWLKVAAKSPELQHFLRANSLDAFLATGSEASQYLAREIERWGAIARTAGLQPA
jgi:tripartite-type tricarboxylate transporter receptor subunit TctC